MELFLQFGWGMMEHTRALINEWKGGTVILSPRDLEPKQLNTLSQDVLKINNGSVLLDPQMYLPRCDHRRLQSHDYWPSDYDSGNFLNGDGLKQLIKNIIKTNQKLKCSKIILPGLIASKVDELWLEFVSRCIKSALSDGTNEDYLATIALEANVVNDPEQIHRILDKAEKWDVNGYYLICEHPNGKYLVEEPLWLANLLDLAAGLKLLGKQVIVGYCNHQMLICATAAVDAICSGTWMNVRSFPPEKFFMQYQDEIKRRSTWYYCPDALSEYKLPWLDIAWKQQILKMLKPSHSSSENLVGQLFTGQQPTAVGLLEKEAFRHYLQSLYLQVDASNQGQFDKAITYHRVLLDTAEELLEKLLLKGVRGQDRDFSEIIEVNRTALDVHESTRGPLLKRKWKSLTS